jgi:hypothetical protein
VGLGQLSADGAATLRAEDLRHRPEGGVRAVRGLEEHHRPLLLVQRSEPTGPLTWLAREEALEAEPVDREP